MSFFAIKSHAILSTSAVLGLLLATSVPVAFAQHADAPFTGLAGNWSGGGTISVASGATEKLRCKVSYAVGGAGTGLNQSLRCASDSFRLEISTSLTSAGGNVSGQWTEATRGAVGNFSGRATSSSIVGTIVGPGFSAGLALNTHGNQQSMTIRPQGATDIREVQVSLRRG